MYSISSGSSPKMSRARTPRQGSQASLWRVLSGEERPTLYFGDPRRRSPASPSPEDPTDGDPGTGASFNPRVGMVGKVGVFQNSFLLTEEGELLL
jgi:hypothetical protein